MEDPMFPALTLLTHPAVLAVGGVVLGAVVGVVVGWQASVLGLDGRPSARDFPWSRLFGFMAFWGTSLLSLAAIARAGDPANPLAEGLGDASSMVLRLVPAAVVLAAATRWKRGQLDEAEDRGREALELARSRTQVVMLAAGAVAAATVTRLSFGVGALIGLAGLVAAWALLAPTQRDAAMASLRDVAAMKDLQSARVLGPRYRLEGQEVTLETVGPLSTWVRDAEGELSEERNAALLERIRRAGQALPAPTRDESVSPP